MFFIYTYNDTEYISACIKRNEPGVTAFLKGLAEREKDSPNAISSELVVCSGCGLNIPFVNINVKEAV